MPKIGYEMRSKIYLQNNREVSYGQVNRALLPIVARIIKKMYMPFNVIETSITTWQDGDYSFNANFGLSIVIEYGEGNKLLIYSQMRKTVLLELFDNDVEYSTIVIKEDLTEFMIEFVIKIQDDRNLNFRKNNYY